MVARIRIFAPNGFDYALGPSARLAPYRDELERAALTSSKESSLGSKDQILHVFKYSTFFASSFDLPESNFRNVGPWLGWKSLESGQQFQKGTVANVHGLGIGIDRLRFR